MPSDAPRTIASFPYPQRGGALDRQILEAALVGQYRIVRELGAGGMSRVYLAEEHALGRLVVIKVLAKELAGSLSVDRFRREIQLAARLQHRGIVPLLSAGDVDGIPYYTMPFVDGEPLAARIDTGPLATSAVLRISRDIAEALSYAHDCGVVHRDIKPANILLVRDHALVTDFGVAKALDAASITVDADILTGTGVTLGTPAYMAPEQAAADPRIDSRADLYSLGIVMFEMLAGVRPFAKRPPAQLLAAHAMEVPQDILSHRSDVPAPLAELVMSLLAKNPDDRPESAGEVLRTLDALSAVHRGSTPIPVVRPRNRSQAFAAAALLTGLVALAAIVYSPRPRPVEASLAVLPLVNAAGNASDDYLSDGLSDQLIAALSKVERLKVAARTSSFAFKGQATDVRAIASRLGVENVLEGSVDRLGSRLRVRMQLTSAQTGFNLWSETYDREFTDVFAIQDEISRSVVAALKGRLTPQDSTAVLASTASSSEAYEAFLRGLFQFNRRGRDGLIRAQASFRESLRHDSSYAPAHAALAMVHVASGNWSFVPSREATDSGRVHAEQAVTLDPNSSEALTALGIVQCQQFEFASCERTLRQAMKINPGYWMAPYALAFLWVSPSGRFDEAVALTRRAQHLDPLNPQIYAALAKTRYLQRRYDLGLQELQVLDDIADAAVTHVWRSHFYRAKGEALLAVSESRRGVEMSGGSPNFLAEHARALFAANQEDSARAIIRGLEQLVARPSFGIAMFFANAGDETRTVAWLDSAYADRSDWIAMLGRAPDFDRYRRNPRVAALTRALGM